MALERFRRPRPRALLPGASAASFDLLPRLEYRGIISGHCNLCLPGLVWELEPKFLKSNEDSTGETKIKHIQRVEVSPKVEEIGKSQRLDTDSLAVSPRLESSGVNSTQCNLCLLGSKDSCDSTSQVVGTTGTCHRTRLIFVFLVEMRFCHVNQAGTESSPIPLCPSPSAKSSDLGTGLLEVVPFTKGGGNVHIAQRGICVTQSNGRSEVASNKSGSSDSSKRQHDSLDSFPGEYDTDISKKLEDILLLHWQDIKGSKYCESFPLSYEENPEQPRMNPSVDSAERQNILIK
ncbi:Zinc finger protein [Plecturocebus cupreus]